MAAGLDPAIRSDPAATVNDRSAHGQEYAERERKQCMKQQVPVLLEYAEF